MVRSLLLLFIFLRISSSCPLDPSPIVTVENGQLMGTIKRFKGNDLYYFLGIPYAKPPINELRFQKPIPADSWNGTKILCSPAPRCFQSESKIFQGIKEMSEDCLYLNIIVSDRAIQEAKSGKKRPVLVYIHGGSFTQSSGSDFPNLSPSLVLTQDIILVTLNYRLDVFGFLYHDTWPGFIGNLGLWDQNLAMKWVKRNIHHFGGDANEITLGGFSAGSVSSSYHVISPISKGLFRRVFLGSGIGLYFNDRANLRVKKATKELIDAIQCSDSTDKLSCLQSKEASEILKIRSKEPYAFSPIYYDKFIPESSREFLACAEPLVNEVDILYGLTKDEGSLFLMKIDPRLLLEKKFDLGLAKDVLTKFFKEESIDDLIQIYFDGQNPKDEIIRTRLVDIFTDVSHVCPKYKFAQKYASVKNAGSVYGFSVNYTPMVRAMNACPHHPIFGVCHGDDLTYIFGVPYENYTQSSQEDLAMSLNMMNIIGTYVRTGKPPKQGTLEWPNWKEESGQASVILEPNTLGNVEIERVERCFKMWDFFEKSLIPKLHFYRSKTE